MWVTPIGPTVFSNALPGERPLSAESREPAYQADQAVRLSSRPYTRLQSFA